MKMQTYGGIKRNTLKFFTKKVSNNEIFNKPRGGNIMNCYKCGKEMRVVPEQVATDEKGLPVYHRIGYCDACMSKFDIDILEKQKNQTVQNNQKPPKKKQSTLSTLAAVFSILTFTIPVAVILAIIDIATGDKKNKLHTGSWFAIIWCVLAVIVYNIGNKPGDDVTIPIAEVKVSVESTEEQAPEPIINKSDTVISPGYTFDADGLQVTINDFDLNFTDYEDEYGWNTPEDGMKYIMIDVSYQNNSKDDKYVSIYDFQCYADNTDCEQNYSVVENSSLNANISSGRNTSYKIAFVVPQDAQSIELEYETSIWTGHKEVIKLQ